MREVRWAVTPLGGVESWSPTLRSSVALLLRSQFPMFLAWGPELRLFYNDAYAQILGDKHPAALGAPFEETWRDIWEVISPLVAGVLRGESTFDEDLLLVMRRRGFDEETYFTFSYSPIADEAVTGLFCACTETTAHVLGARRLGALQRLGELSSAGAETAERACAATVEVLAGQRADVPFALAYLFEPDSATTAAPRSSTGSTSATPASSRAAPAPRASSIHAPPWRCRSRLRAGRRRSGCSWPA